MGIYVPGCQPVPLLALCKQWPLTLPPAACPLVRGGQVALCTLAPGSLLRVGLGDRAAALPRGRRTVPELLQHMDGAVPREGLVPNQKGVYRRGDQAERGGVGFGRREATHLSFSKPAAPFPLYPGAPLSLEKWCSLLNFLFPLRVGPRPGGVPVSGRAAFSLAACRPSKVKGCFWC